MTLRVLMVEDNVLNSELACDLLEIAGHEVRVAPDGATFRSFLEDRWVPDILVMDIRLPDASGVDLLREARAKAEFAHLPAVALTAHALDGDEGRLLSSGFDAVLTKPIDTRTFATSIGLVAARANPTRGSES